ncbi:uncharacterized protein UDID_19428 [Ustilago sp. UG-2017a]|nr:uncharacterized protein UDID_19428 [Ustilago sp. UG-2017a]
MVNAANWFGAKSEMTKLCKVEDTPWRKRTTQKTPSPANWSEVNVQTSIADQVKRSYDKKLAWFNLDLSNRPSKVLKYHSKAVRAVHFNTAWNLVVDASDNGTLQLFYAKVSADLGENLVLVPLKVLRCHEVKGGLGVLDVKWHPNQPWLFSAGADGNAILWTT